MSKRVLLTIEYDGSAYCGWQRQLNGPSVQQKVEEALPEDNAEEASASRETGKTAKPRARKAAAKGEDKAEGEA